MSFILIWYKDSFIVPDMNFDTQKSKGYRVHFYPLVAYILMLNILVMHIIIARAICQPFMEPKCINLASPLIIVTQILKKLPDKFLFFFS